VPLILSGCTGGHDGDSSGSPSLVVCGTTLSAAAAGAELTDATTDVTVTRATVGGTVDLLVAPGCDTGATYTVEHGSAREVVRAATTDGAVAAVALEPTSSSFDVVVRHADGTSSMARVRLAG